jgi:hypothetical protein
MIIPVAGAPYVVAPKSPDDYHAASPVVAGLLDKGVRFVAVAGIGLLSPGDTGQLDDGGPSAARTALAYARGKDEMYVFPRGQLHARSDPGSVPRSRERHRRPARRRRLIIDRAAPRHRRHVVGCRSAGRQLRHPAGVV